MSRVVILMYHALWRDVGQLNDLEPEDRPYALSVSQFAQQLDTLRDMGVAVLDPKELRRGALQRPGVILSFDDGHSSNVELALPELCRRGVQGLFFITTGFTGHRAGYCRREQLRELAAAGMEIGGHGHTHRFLADLDDADLDDELARSRGALSDILGQEVVQMSFPGGRTSPRALRAAREAGFSVLHGSRVGSLQPGIPLPDRALPRIALRAGVSAPLFAAFARADATVMLRARAAALLKESLRSALGSERYHRLYARLKT